MSRLLTGDRIAATLGTLIARYPAFRFRHAPIGRHGNRWIAERINTHDPGLHTLITADLTEFLGALAHDRKSHSERIKGLEPGTRTMITADDRELHSTLNQDRSSHAG